MGKFNTRQGLSSLANSDVLGQFSIDGGGASIPLLVDGATNRLLTLSDTNSGSVFLIQDADGTQLFDITTTGIEVGGSYTLPLTDGTANQYLSTDGSGAVTWEDLPTTGITTVDVHNNTGATLSKGAPVYVTGTHASGKPTVALTDADGTDTYPAIGLVSADIANGADGTVIAGGTLANWDTSAYTAGDALYIDTTAGALTSTRPTAETSKVQKVAMVTRSHATNGSVVVMGAGRTNDIPNDVNLTDLADVGGYGVSGYYLKSTGSGVTWSNPLSQLELSDITKLDLTPTSTDQLPGSVFTYTDASASYDYSFDGPRAGFLAVRQLGSSVTAAAPLSRTGSGYVGNVAEIGVQMTNNNSRCLGLAYSDEISGRFVAITAGLITNIDTSSWSNGDVLYVSNTTGELTNTIPTSGIYIQRVGYVVNSNATTGIIYVNVDPSFDEDSASFITDVTGDVIGDLSNVNVSGAISGNLLRYNGTDWVDTTLTIPASATVSAGTTEVLKFTTSNTGTIAELDLDELGDVDLTTSAPTTNDVLQYDGTNWVPGTVSASTAMEDITNASITPADLVPGNFLLYSATGSGGVWYPANYTLPTSDGSDWQVLTARDLGGTYNNAEWQTLTLTRLGDVNTTGVANGDTLVYNSTSGNFEPGTAGGSQTLDEVLTEGNTSTQDAQFGGVTVSQSDNGSSYIATNSITDGTDWSALSITSTSASPAANDYIGSIKWFGQNDAAQNVNYAKIDVQTTDVGDGVEDATMNFGLMDGGSIAEVLELRGSGITARKSVTVVGGVSAQTATGTSNLFEAVSGDSTGADWPAFAISRYTTTPADNDNVGIFQFNHMNSASSLKTFADIEVVATDVTSGTEDGKLIFNILEDGTSTQKLQLIPAGAVVDGTATADIFSLSTTDDTGQFLATRTISVPTDWNAFEAFRYDATYATGPIGSQAFSALNDADETIRYARATGVITDSTDASEDGQWRWYAMVAGTDTELMRLDGDGLLLGSSSGFTLPLTDGTSNQVLQTDGSGNVSWATVSSSVSAINDIGDVNITSPSTNQVLTYNSINSEWRNTSVPIPTLAEVTASGSSTTTTITLASILQTGSTINVAASGNHYSQLRATTLEVGTSSTEQYQFPASDGNAGEILTTDGSGALSFGKARSLTFSNSGVHQLTTANDTHYRYCSATTATNSTYWGRTSTSVPTSITRTAQYAKAGHVIPVDITDAVVNATVSISVSASASSDSAASEYNGDTVSFYLYRWADGATATQVATWTDVINGGVSYAEEQSSPTEFTLTASAGDSLFLVSRCLQNATATRYMSMQYTIDIQY